MEVDLKNMSHKELMGLFRNNSLLMHKAAARLSLNNSKENQEEFDRRCSMNEELNCERKRRLLLGKAKLESDAKKVVEKFNQSIDDFEEIIGGAMKGVEKIIVKEGETFYSKMQEFKIKNDCFSERISRYKGKESEIVFLLRNNNKN